MTTNSIISKVWSFCHTLRDDGVGYGDYPLGANRPSHDHIVTIIEMTANRSINRECSVYSV